MRYLRTVAAALVLAFLTASTAPAASPKKVNCRKDLKKARELINDRWSFKLFKPGAVDLDEAFRQLEPSAKRADTPEACARVIARFMAKLGDGHSRLQYYPDLNYTAPLMVIRSQRERLSQVPGERPKVHAYLLARDTTDEVLKTIPRGSEILKVDGVAIDGLYREMVQYVSGSTSQWKDYISDRQLLLGPAETEIELTYREPGGARKSVTVLRPSPDSLKETPKEVRVHLGWEEESSSQRLEGGWGYIKYTSFSLRSPKRTVELFDEALDAIFDAPGLIIDLRGNGGGYVDAISKIAGRFIAARETMGFYSVRTPGQETISRVWDEATGSVISKPRLLATPRKEIYTGPVVILIDRACFSACESFTGGLQSFERVLVIGPEASGGGSGFVGGLELPSGAIISFSWTVAWLPNGQQIEGNGVAPDILVKERSRDWAVGRDRVLDRAIKALEQGEAKPLTAVET